LYHLQILSRRKEPEMEERRAIGRVGYSANAVIVVCDTQEKYYVHTENVSPLGMALRVPEEVPDILGKDIILVADTLIMYADVTRQEKQEDGSGILGIAARKFSEDVLQYLFERIGTGEEEVE
jgi:hypothetical protein